VVGAQDLTSLDLGLVKKNAFIPSCVRQGLMNLMFSAEGLELEIGQHFVESSKRDGECLEIGWFL
jgi:hypothetical protein